MFEFFLRTLLLVSLTVLAGGLAFNVLVLRAASLQPLREAMTERRRNWLILWTMAVFVFIHLEILIRFNRGDLSTAVVSVLVARYVLLGILIFGLRDPTRDSMPALVLCALLLLTQSLQGHAMREPAPVLPVITDWLHLVFVSIWLGGVAYYAGVVVPQGLQQRALVPALGASIATFSPLAMMSVLVIAITGIIQSASFVGSVDALLNTDYGRALLFKIVVFLALMGFGAFHQFVIAPAINAWRAKAETQEDAARRFRISITIEALVGILALAAAAGMTLLPLARILT